MRSGLRRPASGWRTAPGSQLIVGHPGLDLVLVVKDLGGAAFHGTLWGPVRPAVIALDPVYQGDEGGAFCSAYGAMRTRRTYGDDGTGVRGGPGRLPVDKYPGALPPFFFFACPRVIETSASASRLRYDSRSHRADGCPAGVGRHTRSHARARMGPLGTLLRRRARATDGGGGHAARGLAAHARRDVLATRSADRCPCGVALVGTMTDGSRREMEALEFGLTPNSEFGRRLPPDPRWLGKTCGKARPRLQPARGGAPARRLVALRADVTVSTRPGAAPPAVPRWSADCLLGAMSRWLAQLVTSRHPARRMDVTMTGARGCTPPREHLMRLFVLLVRPSRRGDARLIGRSGSSPSRQPDRVGFQKAPP